jgi:hypothetical protein
MDGTSLSAGDERMRERVERLGAGIRDARAEVAKMQSRLSAEPGDELPATIGERAGMIALNMALNGASRDETERYLEQSFELPDRAHIVDAAYEQVRRLRGA